MCCQYKWFHGRMCPQPFNLEENVRLLLPCIILLWCYFKSKIFLIRHEQALNNNFSVQLFFLFFCILLLFGVRSFILSNYSFLKFEGQNFQSQKTLQHVGNTPSDRKQNYKEYQIIKPLKYISCRSTYQWFTSWWTPASLELTCALASIQSQLEVASQGGVRTLLGRGPPGCDGGRSNSIATGFSVPCGPRKKMVLVPYALRPSIAFTRSTNGR